jgi:hypothetical protein
MMALENLAGVAVLQGDSGGAGRVVEQIDSDGKIRAVKKSRAALLDQLADLLDLGVPARGADDDILAGFYAGLDIGQHAMRRSKVDDDLNVVKLLGCKGSTSSVLRGAGDFDLVLPLAGHFGYQRSRLAAA